ncbi:MAG: cyanoexosortase A [Leptolyngbya sp. SIO1D8]|nr:cyanoexosortase A [Leptolyngbya sp. SIO1D8]
MTTQHSQLAPKHFQYIPLAVLATLLSIYMGLLWRYDDTAHLGMSALFILATGMLLWEQRQTKQLTPNHRGLLLGIFGIVLTLGLSRFLFQQQAIVPGDPLNTPSVVVPLRLLPALIAISVSVLASGLAGIRQFWREEVLLLALGLPGVIALFLADISPLTAMFSAGLLQVGGFDVVREGVLINLPNGTVEVYYGCSGMESICYLLSLSALFLILFPVSGFRQYMAPISGIVLGFVINSFRVALMAILWAARDVERFDYWHEGEGSLIFGLMAVIAFGAFYVGVLQNLESRQTASTL